MYCVNCGGANDDIARYCTFCGREVIPIGVEVAPPLTEAQRAYAAGGEPSPLDQVIAAIERQMAPGGSVVVCFELWLRYPRRVEYVTDSGTGEFDDETRDELSRLLVEALESEAYIYAELEIDGDPVSCVWHAISSYLCPLTAEHASALLFRYDMLMPTTSVTDETEDAPDVSLV